MSRPVRQTGGAGRAVVAAALALAALLVLVALASRGHLGSDAGSGGDRGRVALPPGAFGWVYALLLVLGVLGLPFFFYIYARETPYSKSSRRKARLAPFVLVAAFGLLFFAVTRWREEFADVLARFPGFRNSLRDGEDAARAAQPPAPEWAPLVVMSSLVVVGLGGWFAWRQLLRKTRRRGESLAETLTDAVGDSLDDLRAEPDPRRAIILAYARMERALDESGVPRRESEAPLEYLSRILLELHVSPAPVFSLTELFEHAKFSHHAVDAEMKDESITALEDIRDELRELE